MRVLSLSGILGYGYSHKSLEEAVKQKIDVIGVDGGSTDPGPFYLGAGRSFTNAEATRRDLELVLPYAVNNRIPFIIGTAGGSGAYPHVRWVRDIIENVVQEQSLHCRMAIIHCDVSKEYVKEKLRAGKIRPMRDDIPVREEDIDSSVAIVGQIGVEPFIQALEQKVDIVLAGRACDTAVFAAMPIMKGYDPGLVYHMAKIIECGAMCAEPMSASDMISAVLNEESFLLEPPNADRRCTVERVAAHTLYEQANPYYIYEPDGMVDLTNSLYVQETERAVRVSNSRFVPSATPTIKVEGVKQSGFRTICVAGTADPVMISGIRETVERVKEHVAANLSNISPRQYRLNVRTYGVDAVGMYASTQSQLQATSAPGHFPVEIGLLIDVVGESQDIADTVCALTRAVLLHYDYPGRKATGGNLAFPFSPSDISMGPVYEFSLYHLIEVDNPGETATIEYVTIGEHHG